MKNEDNLMELFTGTKSNSNVDFYIKMMFIGYDVYKDQATEEDTKYYNENYDKFIVVERFMIQELKDLKTTLYSY